MRHPLPRRGLLALGGALALPACSFPERGVPVPRGQTSRASVLGLANERFFPAQGNAAMEHEYAESFRRRIAFLGGAAASAHHKFDILAISGGGEDGAFGAGLLCGWTDAGTRPVFELVTGVSTGALTAPFAFLGSAYDPGLRDVYTGISIAQVLRQRYLTAALLDDALADTAPLFETISRHVDERMLAAIAQGYREGRMLFVGSTNLDAQTPVIWNIGAIAASGDPRALNLVRKLLLASASIPGAFPPQMIDVTVDGQPHQEMHVDGGAFAQLFLYPASITVSRRERLRRRQTVASIEAYIIRNARLDPDWAAVDRRTMTIAARAISTMIASAGFNDILRVYHTTQADQVGFNLAYIGRDFSEILASPFDQTYMRALFEHGYTRARRGMDWAKAPPFVSGSPPTPG